VNINRPPRPRLDLHKPLNMDEIVLENEVKPSQLRIRCFGVLR